VRPMWLPAQGGPVLIGMDFPHQQSDAGCALTAADRCAVKCGTSGFVYPGGFPGSIRRLGAAGGWKWFRQATTHRKTTASVVPGSFSGAKLSREVQAGHRSRSAR